MNDGHPGVAPKIGYFLLGHNTLKYEDSGVPERHILIPFYQFHCPTSRELGVDFEKESQQWEYTSCPIGGQHKSRRQRIGPLHHFVKHNRREERIIWGLDIAVHQSVVGDLERQGFTGFRSRPAKVTFLDGKTSDDYREFIVTGWAGVVRPESGMRMLDSCPGCKWKDYGPITDFAQVIDWDQWSGEDFFFVWPLTGHKLCTERAAQWLEESEIRSFTLGRQFELLEKDKNRLSFGIPRGPLSEYLPEDLAIRYGRPLGLE